MDLNEDSMTPAQALLQELASEPINILKVRNICKNNPGLIASLGLRPRVWALLLLGRSYDITDTDEIHITDAITHTKCQEQHVLEADVVRTRGEIEEFVVIPSYRQALTDILHTFCIEHDVQYKQGMNEVLAPFVYLFPPPVKGNAMPYYLFESFLYRYLERYFCLDDQSFLFKAFRLFHLLLVYYDPQLGLHLLVNNFPPVATLLYFSMCMPVFNVARCAWVFCRSCIRRNGSSRCTRDPYLSHT
jgi:hypothetical protein